MALRGSVVQGHKLDFSLSGLKRLLQTFLIEFAHSHQNLLLKSQILLNLPLCRGCLNSWQRWLRETPHLRKGRSLCFN